MRKMLIGTAITKGYKIFELIDDSNQQCLIVAVINEDIDDCWHVVHNITHSEFVSDHTVIGGYGGSAETNELEVLKHCTSFNSKIVSVNDITATYGKNATAKKERRDENMFKGKGHLFDKPIDPEQVSAFSPLLAATLPLSTPTESELIHRGNRGEDD